VLTIPPGYELEVEVEVSRQVAFGEFGWADQEEFHVGAG
jgi:hypothetical protein